ncbi:10003_t:CDS:2 [Ambispora leptoticha]|uniref:10003_t:CDS:1 n=1 Tax=Ambispora leptoticha TaxID=144679 RepID=A0A9N9BAJ0_9GLOM|nr:10003_t:CDS:2 [Ambispora leptoticha]
MNNKSITVTTSNTTFYPSPPPPANTQSISSAFDIPLSFLGLARVVQFSRFVTRSRSMIGKRRAPDIGCG